MRLKAMLTIIVVSSVLLAVQVHAAGFRGLGFLPGDIGSNATGISADGSVVVGNSHDGPIREAFQWTAAGGMEGLGYREMAINPGSDANGVSGDGNTPVGRVYIESVIIRAAKWEAPGAWEYLPFISGFEAEAFAASHDGSAIVGNSIGNMPLETLEAFFWTAAEGTRGLGVLRGHDASSAHGISADGQVVAGASWDTSSGVHEAFRWTAKGGMVGLGHIRGYEGSEARDVSADGHTIVGFCTSADGEEAFRWRRGAPELPFIRERMEGLGDLRGGIVASRAYGVSKDGEIIVGVGNSNRGDQAVIWMGDRLYNLRSYLMKTFGLPLGRWTLTEARDVSADGKTIVGVGINPDGETEAWIANIAKSPRPGKPLPGDPRIFPLP